MIPHRLRTFEKPIYPKAGERQHLVLMVAVIVNQYSILAAPHLSHALTLFSGRKISFKMWTGVFFFLALAGGVVSGLNTVLYGPAARELLLLAAKVAAREGLETSCVCAPGTEDGCRRLMYGTEYTKDGGDKPGYARPVSSGGDIQASLEAADSLIFVAYDTPIDEKSYNILLDSTGDKLSKVVLMSKMGVTKAKGGFFGGNDGKLLESENLLREICKKKGLALSIVRAGTLKGGGPGEEGNDFGLDKCYYNTLLDVVEASVTMAHDKYTLGLDCRTGDSVEVPNMFTQMGSKSSFEACPWDTNRIVVAGGVVAAALYDKPIEFSVSAEKATEPPTLTAWNEAFSTII